MVCGAELPVENTSVLTGGLGISGALAGKGSSFRVAIFTSGAGASCTFGLG